MLEALREKIDAAYASNAEFLKAAQKFLKHAKDTINPSVTEADVREMLIQHILTEEIFANVFNESDFHQHNNVARELYALEAEFFTGCLLYTSDAADERSSVDLGGRRIIKKKKKGKSTRQTMTQLKRPMESTQSKKDRSYTD